MALLRKREISPQLEKSESTTHLQNKESRVYQFIYQHHLSLSGTETIRHIFKQYSLHLCHPVTHNDFTLNVCREICAGRDAFPGLISEKPSMDLLQHGPATSEVLVGEAGPWVPPLCEVKF